MQSTYDKIQFYKIGPREKNNIIKKLKELIIREKRIQLALVFGSITRRNSIRDVDLCIYTIPKLSFRELLSMNAQIELDVGMPVDLVELTDLPPSLRMNILGNGILIKGQKTLLHELQNQVKAKI